MTPTLPEFWMQANREILLFLGRQSLYVLVLFPVILVLARLFKTKHPAWQHWLWLLILVRLILPTDLSGPWSLGNVGSLGRLGIGLVPPAARVVPARTVIDPAETPGRRLHQPRQDPLPGSRVTTDRSSPFPALPVSHAFQSGLCIAWAVGTCLFLVLFAAKRFKFIRMAGRARPVSDPQILAMVSQWKERLHIQRPVTVLASENAVSPFTLGVSRPRIVLPAFLLEPENRVSPESVIAHELAHIRRRDDLWIILEQVIRALYFFHPVVWVACRRIHLARELVCDRAVLAPGRISPRQYARNFLDMVRLMPVRRRPATAAGPAGFGTGAHTLSLRIKAMLKEEPMKPNPVLFIGFFLVLSIFLLPMAPNASPVSGRSLENISWVNSLEGWFGKIYDARIHSRTPLPPGLSTKGANPNILSPPMQSAGFRDCMDNQKTPGITYAGKGLAITSTAAGIVHFVGEGRQVADNAGGFYVRIYHDLHDGLRERHYHRVTLYHSQAYRSTYYHLERVVVNQYQIVTRGQLIGYGFAGQGKPAVKFVVEERGNFVDPDNYGPDHGFMAYAATHPAAETGLDEMNQRLDVQQALVKELNELYTDRAADRLFSKVHTSVDTEKFPNYPVNWSTVERFRYLAGLYKKSPALFPDLSPDRFDALTARFLANQPIVLSLPFRVP